MTGASTLAGTGLPSILLSSSQNCPATGSFHHIRWYSWWVHEKIQSEPKELFSALPGHDSISDKHGTDSFTLLWQEISRHMTENTYVSIDWIMTQLVKDKILQPADNHEALFMAWKLVFAVIGWQTMLYRPDFGSCPPVEIAIVDEMDGHQGHAHMCLKQSVLACKNNIHKILLGFGVLLPPRNFNAADSSEDKAAFKEFKTVAPATFNAHLLSSIAGVKIKWIDSLACHLEFDPDSNTLFLFRYPSFCVANLPLGESTAPHKSVIHACAAPCATHASSACTRWWADADEVTLMLRETILSYRLLFGQDKAARRLFRKLRPFDGVPEDGRDNFLWTLCDRKQFHTTVEIAERESYDLPRDFPILRSRLAVLLRHLSNKKPRTLKQLWQDKRDSASWLTFWAVLVIGGLGILLAFIQVVLQIVQIVQRE